MGFLEGFAQGVSEHLAKSKENKDLADREKAKLILQGIVEGNLQPTTNPQEAMVSEPEVIKRGFLGTGIGQQTGQRYYTKPKIQIPQVKKGEKLTTHIDEKGKTSYSIAPDDPFGLKENQQQDRLEQQAIQRLSSIRGDTSIARIEMQRDASITAYNTIQTIKNEGRIPSQIEYYDIIGQLWKARTGASPTDQAIRDLDAKTFKGNLAKAAQYFTGKPMGVTTEEILNNIQNFAKVSGEQADKLHEGYMKTHLIKPTGLDEERWNSIKSNNRGLSFGEATNQKYIRQGTDPTTGKRVGMLPDGTIEEIK